MKAILVIDVPVDDSVEIDEIPNTCRWMRA